jgi:hypothetical protein
MCVATQHYIAFAGAYSETNGGLTSGVVSHFRIRERNASSSFFHYITDYITTLRYSRETYVQDPAHTRIK